MSWRGILMLILLAAAAISGWSLWSQRHKDASVPVVAGRSDYVLHDFELVALDEQGQESFTLRAPRLVRDPNKKSMDIAMPLFLIPAKPGSGGDAWEVRAQTGWISPKGEELRLRGDVKADSQSATGPIAMRTEELNVFPDAKRATSSAAVTITQPGHILSGRDLEAMLASNRITLKSVKERYERNAR